MLIVDPTGAAALTTLSESSSPVAGLEPIHGMVPDADGHFLVTVGNNVRILGSASDSSYAGGFGSDVLITWANVAVTGGQNITGLDAGTGAPTWQLAVGGEPIAAMSDGIAVLDNSGVTLARFDGSTRRLIDGSIESPAFVRGQWRGGRSGVFAAIGPEQPDQDSSAFQGPRGGPQLRAAPRSREIRITINGFIPGGFAEVIGYSWALDTVFEGDDRSWNEGGAYRVSQRFWVNRNGLVVENVWNVNRTGTSRKFEKSTSLDPSGSQISEEAKADTVIGAPMMIATAKAPITTMFVTERPALPNYVTVECTVAGSSGILPFWETGAIVNDITYTFIIDIDFTNPMKPTYQLVGEHDSFPNYEVYVNGVRVYEFDHIPGGFTPLSLFPPIDIFGSVSGAVR